LYAEAREKLKASGAVYPCFCSSRWDEQVDFQDDEADDPAMAFRCPCGDLSKDEIAAKTQALDAVPALRFRVDRHASHFVHDLVRGDVTFPPGEVEDFVITKNGGAPLYNFACVVDDALMQITHVIRGEEHLSNVPKQILMYKALGHEPPQFAHLPILLNSDRKKLSKRDGATAIGDYRRLGFLPNALVNFLALLGWSPGEDREIMKLDEMLALFDLERVQKHGAVFDTVKLTWMNGEYMKVAKIDTLVDGVLELIEFEPDVAQLRTDRWHVTAICELLRGRAKTLAEIIKANKYLFLTDVVLPWDPQAVQKRAGTSQALDNLRMLSNSLRDTVEWDRISLEENLRTLSSQSGVKAGDFIQPLRVAVTGQSVSPGIFETIEVLGREVTLGRVHAFLTAQTAGSIA
ncbi:MAG: glutamate--tRNA ligase, partial [Candidatus Eremiobacteraeota bacterium]|nr:glutamate--tRNA ligase [Candidatus Eremiobacteraeota bacterium]